MATKKGSATAERLSRVVDLLSAAALARAERFVAVEPAEILTDSKTGKALADEARSLAALQAGVDKLAPEGGDDEPESREEDDDHDLDRAAILADFDRRPTRLGLPRRRDLPEGDPRNAGPGGVSPGLAARGPCGPDTA